MQTGAGAMTAPNAPYYGDILRNHIGAMTVDLVYLDPPFTSKRDDNVLKRRGGRPVLVQPPSFV